MSSRVLTADEESEDNEGPDSRTAAEYATPDVDAVAAAAAPAAPVPPAASSPELKESPPDMSCKASSPKRKVGSVQYTKP